MEGALEHIVLVAQKHEGWHQVGSTAAGKRLHRGDDLAWARARQGFDEELHARQVELFGGPGLGVIGSEDGASEEGDVRPAQRDRGGDPPESAARRDEGELARRPSPELREEQNESGGSRLGEPHDRAVDDGSGAITNARGQSEVDELEASAVNGMAERPVDDPGGEHREQRAPGEEAEHAAGEHQRRHQAGRAHDTGARKHPPSDHELRHEGEHVHRRVVARKEGAQMLGRDPRGRHGFEQVVGK